MATQVTTVKDRTDVETQVKIKRQLKRRGEKQEASYRKCKGTR